jgi:hypothetical protein
VLDKWLRTGFVERREGALRHWLATCRAASENNSIDALTHVWEARQMVSGDADQGYSLGCWLAPEAAEWVRGMAVDRIGFKQLGSRLRAP